MSDGFSCLKVCLEIFVVMVVVNMLDYVTLTSVLQTMFGTVGYILAGYVTVS